MDQPHIVQLLELYYSEQTVKQLNKTESQLVNQFQEPVP